MNPALQNSPEPSSVENTLFNRFQVSPLSVDLRRPTPSHQFPVPAYTMLLFEGAIAMAPIPRAGSESDFGFQVAPPSEVFHTPLPGFPIKTVFGSSGATCIDDVHAPK